MRWAEFDANDPLTFSVELLESRKAEAISADGAKQFQWLSSKVFPLLVGKSIDAAYLVALALVNFTLQVMQDREDAGMSPKPST